MTRQYFACPPVKSHAARCLVIVAPSSPFSAPGSRLLPAGGSGVEGSFSPADLQSAYKLPSSTNGRGQTVAVVFYLDMSLDTSRVPHSSRKLHIVREQPPAQSQLLPAATRYQLPSLRPHRRSEPGWDV